MLLSIHMTSISQITRAFKAPAGFKYVKGDSPSGRLDYYTKGHYTILGDVPFQSYDGEINKKDLIKYLSDSYGFPFKLTSDSIYWGTGINAHDKSFRYTVVANGVALILCSTYDDADFATYSKWLLLYVRDKIKYKQHIYFP
jgi:hypothetical protein